MADNHYAHSESAEKSRRAKAVELAKYSWDRNISPDELDAMPAEARRKLARAAGINPPSTHETWHSVSTLLAEKAEWAAAHPEHSSSAREHADEKILWVKPPVKPW